jgi:hypothetical protein
VGVDLAHLHLLAERRGEFAGVGSGSREVGPVLGLRGGPAYAVAACSEIDVVLRHLGLQLVHVGHLCCLLVLADFDDEVLALIAAMAYDFGDCAHEAHREARLARACLETAGPWASPDSGGAVQYRLCARPSLGARDIYAGSCEEGRGGGGSVLLLLGGAVGRGLEEVVDVVVVRGRLGLGLCSGGEFVGLFKDLGLPATLGKQLARSILSVDHGAARRPDWRG